MKISLIVQRYGGDVVGGAERLCRGVAEGLAADHEVEVLTSCALSYRTWANHYREGVEQVNGVRVRRFRAHQERDIEAFNAMSEELFGGGERTPEQERAWIDAQGPFVPGLVDHLHAGGRDRDLLLFFTYLYYPTVHGIHVAPERSVLVPTAHDEAPFWMETYRSVFMLPAGLIFNTRAEQELVRRRFPEANQPAEVCGVGIEGIEELAEAAREARRGELAPTAASAARRPTGDATAARTDPTGTEGKPQTAKEPATLLYAGRIEEGKGAAELLRFVERYRDRSGRDLRLWLMGEVAMDLPDQPWISPLGFVSEEEKRRRLAAATLLVAPSRLESFGIVLLEATVAGTPVLANGASEAYVEHCRNGNCGLYYENYDEFAAALDLLLADDRLRESLARDGADYARRRFSWDAIAGRYDRFLRRVVAPA
jgi:glycosyltransferase involved in cell wall biosynthesis